METKLQRLLVLSAFALAGMQTSIAQMGTGGAFNGPHTISSTTPLVLQLEDFDLGANQHPTGNPGGVAPFGYANQDAGNDANGAIGYRSDTDADIGESVDANGVPNIVVGGVARAEWFYYTIDVPAGSAGNYKAFVSYRSNGGDKSIKLSSFSMDLSTSTVLYDAGRTLPSATFADEHESTEFALPEGQFVLQVAFDNGTPVFDFIRFEFQSTLGVNDIVLEENALRAYPNPAANGLFELNVDSKWEVYSILGTKVLEGSGRNVDLSSQSKGAYFLKVGNVSKRLLKL